MLRLPASPAVYNIDGARQGLSIMESLRAASQQSQEMFLRHHRSGCPEVPRLLEREQVLYLECGRCCVCEVVL